MEKNEIEVVGQRYDLLPVQYASADVHPVRVYLHSISPVSRDTVRSSLQTIAKIACPEIEDLLYIPWHLFRFQHVQAVRAELLARKYKTGTANTMMAALKGVLRTCWELGFMTTDDYTKAVHVKRTPGESIPPSQKGRHVEVNERVALMVTCSAEGTKLSARDAAILAVGFGCGLRRMEIVDLDLDDYKEASIRVRHGKGNRSRSVPVEGSVADAIDAWLEIRGLEPGPLFTRIRRGDSLTLERLAGISIAYICEERALRAGVKLFTPHDMRRTFAGELLDAGVDLSTAQKLMGHSDPATTSGYDRRGERAARDAVKKIYFPYFAAKGGKK